MKNFSKYFILGIFITILFSNYFYGSFKINSFNKNTKSSNQTINFKIVTAGLKLSEFNDPKNVASKLIKMSEPEKEKNTIFVWPEGAFMSEYFFKVKKNEKIKKLFRENFSKNHLIILGASTLKKNNLKEKYFNSMIVVDNNLNIVSKYDKKKLVPFGEFLPLENLLSGLGLKKITPGYSSFSKGETKSLLEFDFKEINLKLLPLVCYEIIFHDFIEKNKNQFDLIVNISEDAWFGDSIGPHQHFAKAIFRSIESRKFLIRSANKGKSVFVDPTGKVIKVLQPNESGNIELEIPILEDTNYQYKKSLIFLLLLITYVLAFFILRKLKI